MLLNCKFSNLQLGKSSKKSCNTTMCYTRNNGTKHKFMANYTSEELYSNIFCYLGYYSIKLILAFFVVYSTDRLTLLRRLLAAQSDFVLAEVICG